MNREKFIKLSGWALIIGSIAIFIGWMAESRPKYDQFNAASLPIDRYANLAAVPLIIMGVCMCVYIPVSMLLNGVLTSYTESAWTLTYLRLTRDPAAGMPAPVLPDMDDDKTFLARPNA